MDYKPPYQRALEAAGAKVIEFVEFGSYQGDWYAVVDSELPVITGSYGSCSSCDAFEAEFGWKDDEQPDYNERLKSFGEAYVKEAMTFDEAIKELDPDTSWKDEKEQYDWLLKEKEKYNWLINQYQT